MLRVLRYVCFFMSTLDPFANTTSSEFRSNATLTNTFNEIAKASSYNDYVVLAFFDIGGAAYLS